MTFRAFLCCVVLSCPLLSCVKQPLTVGAGPFIFVIKKGMLFTRVLSFFRFPSRVAPHSLAISGVKTPLTPSPDAAELAAAFLLDRLSGCDADDASIQEKIPAAHTAAYYQALSRRVGERHAQEERLALRAVVFCEDRLSHSSTFDGKEYELEDALFAVHDCVERVRGLLQERWRRCLALVTLRQVEAAGV